MLHDPTQIMSWWRCCAELTFLTLQLTRTGLAVGPHSWIDLALEHRHHRLGRLQNPDSCNAAPFFTTLQITREELVASLRSQSKGFAKTSSQFRGVTRHQKGKWEARIGQVTSILALQ